MRYVTAGYVFVLVVLALYSAQLIWRRRRLALAVDLVAGRGAATSSTGPASTGPGGAVLTKPAGEVP